MTENKLNTTSDTDHTQIETLIPWYINGTLTVKETTAFQQHLAICKICQQELSRCQALAGQIPTSEEIWQATPMHFANILAQVEQLESANQKTAAMPKKTKPSFIDNLHTWFKHTPSPVRWTLTLETLAIAALILFVVLPQAPLTKVSTEYETLSNAVPTVTEQGVMIRLVLADDLTLQELSDLLKQSHAQLREGPSTVGSYTIEVPTADQSKSLKLLRANPKIRLAQPIAP